MGLLLFSGSQPTCRTLLIENPVPIPDEREAFDFYATHEFLADPKSTLLPWALLLITVGLDDYLPDMQPRHHFRQ